MRKQFLLLTTILSLGTSAIAGLPEALMSLNYQQYTTAFNEFNELVNQGNAAALYYLGRMYQDGLGVPQNISLAVNYFKSADEAFYLPAASQLGKILLHGEKGIPANPAQAIILLKKAALSGDAEAAFELGNAVLAGQGEEAPNYNHAFGYFLIAALKGERRAQYQLSQMYLSGRGIPQNYQKALIWMTKSANQGFVRAQIELANLAENNIQLKNLGEAYSWNSILAAYNSDSIGTTAARKRDDLAKKIRSKDLAERQAQIRSWAPQTAEKSVTDEERSKVTIPTIPGFNDPKTLQQILLQEGTLPQDPTAFGLTRQEIDIAEATGDRVPLTTAIEKAVKREKIQAAAFYGDLLRKRFHDMEEAVKWYQTGADAGDPYARYQLSRAYCEGWSTPPDAAKCYNWLLLTKETPDPVLNGLIQQAILTVRANATPDELKRGESQAAAYQKKTQDKEKEKSIFDLF